MSGLVVVRRFAGQAKFVCRVCGTPFHDGEDRAYQAHVVGCANQHEGELQELSMRHRMPAFFEKNDIDAYIARNREALIEGRKKL